MRVLGGEGSVRFLRWNVTNRHMNPNLRVFDAVIAHPRYQRPRVATKEPSLPHEADAIHLRDPLWFPGGQLQLSLFYRGNQIYVVVAQKVQTV
jgi:hypothetical protein